MTRILRSLAFAAALLLPALAARAADEPKFELRPGDSVKTVLDDAVNRPVTLILNSGQEITGTVVKVGDHAVHLARLVGRDYFDAVILLERVDGVVVKVRGK